MHIFSAIDLARTFDIRVSRQGLLDKTPQPLLALGVTLDRFDNEAMRGASGFAGERGDACQFALPADGHEWLGCSSPYFFSILEHMGNREFLSQHELLVMLAVLRLGREAYGVPIGAEIAERTGREMLLGSVYATLDILERKGFVESRLGEATAKRGGRAKTYFRLTALGLRELREAQRGLRALSEGLSQLEGVRP